MQKAKGMGGVECIGMKRTGMAGRIDMAPAVAQHEKEEEEEKEVGSGQLVLAPERLRGVSYC